MQNKIINLVIVFLLLLSPMVYSFGITSPFFDDNIHMYVGEKRVITFLLQNMVGEKDINAKVEMLEGAEIARVADGLELYSIPYGRNDIPVNIEIYIPLGITKNEYIVDFMIKTIASPDVRQVQLATGLEKRFKVIIDGVRPPTDTANVQQEIVPQPKIEEPGEILGVKSDRQTVLLAVFLVIIIIILYKWVRKHKEKYDLQRLKDEFSL